MTWKTGDPIEKALSLPVGSDPNFRYGQNFRTVYKPDVIFAAQSINTANIPTEVKTQQEILRLAYLEGLAFQEYWY